MKKMRLISAILAIVMLLGILAGCAVPETPAASGSNPGTSAGSGTGKTEDVKIGLSMNTTTNAWRACLVAKAQETADAHGAELVVLDAAGKADKQQADLEDLVAQGVDAIVIDVCDGEALKTAINNVVAQGIPVIAVDTSVASGTNVTSFITADNYTVGLNVGRAMAAAWNSAETPNAVIVSGAIGDREGGQRRQGFVAGFLEYQYEVFGGGSINILSQKYASDWDAQTGVNQLQDIMAQYPEGIDMWFSETDVITIPGIDAIKAVNYDGFEIIGSVDGQREFLELIKDGKAVACGVNSAVNMGVMGIEYALEVVAGNPVAANAFVDSPCITADNVDSYLENGMDFQ